MLKKINKNNSRKEKNVNQNNINQPTKKEVEKNYKVERLLKKEGINQENIIIGKRNR